MTIGSLGGVSSLAASPTTQRTSDTEKTQAATSDKGRADSAAEYAEQAAGIGETREESESSDRDADGRRLWEFGEKKKEEEAAAEASESAPLPQAKDPSGSSGSNLDLTG
jgi:hypothetical protein